LGEKGIASFIARLRNYLTEVTTQRIRMLQPDAARMQIPIDIVAGYSSGAILGLVTWWLENDMPVSPEEMSQKTLLLIAYGTYWGIGLDVPKPS
jgi:hypothetical protein